MEDASRPSPSRTPVDGSPRAIDQLPDSWGASVAPWRRRLDDAVTPRLEASFGFVESRWPLLASLASALVILGAYLSPLLQHLGYGDIGKAIFGAYYYLCAQTPGHSFFPWGYQAALDQRMTAIYGTVAVAGLLYNRYYRKISHLSWRLYLLLILPLALDGFTQAFGWRQSNWELRTLTGAIFGVASVLAFYTRFDRMITGSAL